MKLSKVSAEVILETNSDLAVVNAARVSFSKASQWIVPKILTPTLAHLECPKMLSKDDQGLISYLAKHNHWSPFAHSAEVYSMILTPEERLSIYDNLSCNLGLTIVNYQSFAGENTIVKGSLYAWARELKVFPRELQVIIAKDLLKKYPVAAKALAIDELTLEPLGSDPRRFYVVDYGSGLSDESIALRLSLDDLSYSPEAGKDNLWNLSKMASVTLRIKAPVFIARQLEKHHEGFAWNEVSRRYVKGAPEFYALDGFRAAPKPDPVTGKVNNKQGSSDAYVETLVGSYGTPKNLYSYICNEALDVYKDLLQSGVAPEDARIVLPQSMMTEWYWTGSLSDWLRVYNLRSKDDTQAKTREVAELINEELTKVYPKTWEHLKARG